MKSFEGSLKQIAGPWYGLGRQLVQGEGFGIHTSLTYVILSACLWVKWHSLIITRNLSMTVWPCCVTTDSHPLHSKNAHLGGGWGSLLFTNLIPAFCLASHWWTLRTDVAIFLPYHFTVWPTFIEHGPYMSEFLALWINFTACLICVNVCA